LESEEQMIGTPAALAILLSTLPSGPVRQEAEAMPSFMSLYPSEAIQENDDEELRRKIEEKRQKLKERHRENREEELKLNEEIAELWEKLNGPPPRALWFSVESPYRFWRHRLSIADGPGIELAFSIGSLSVYDEEGAVRRVVFIPLPAPDNGMLGFGMRYFSARDEKAGGRVDVLTYEIVRWGFDRTWPSGVGLGGTFIFGLTRLANRGLGGDRDTGLDFALEFPHVTYSAGRSLRVGLGVTWGLLETSFNQDHTRGIYSVSPSLSLELLF
jgi:hypothetical protein